MRLLIAKVRRKPLFWLIGVLLLACGSSFALLRTRAHLRPQALGHGPLPKASLTFEPLTARQALRIDHDPKIRFRYEDTLDRFGDAPFSEAHTRHEAIDLIEKETTSIQPGKRMAAYFGTLHSHTGWSDGADDPKTAFAFGRDVAHLDFMAVSDHTEYWIVGDEERWAQTAQAARDASRDDFIALRGFEYSHPFEGHIVVLESNDYCSALRCRSIASFFDWLKQPAQAGALAIFAHPGFRKDIDDATEFNALRFDPALRRSFFAMEVIHWDGYLPFLRRKAPPSYFDRATAQGWRLGPMGSQDNHRRNWGASGQNRIGVLLERLDRESLITALRERRFYATSNDNLQFSFSLKQGPNNWLPMGKNVPWSDIEGDELEVEARFFDPDPWDQLRRFELVFDGAVIASLDFPTAKESPSKPTPFPFRKRIRTGRITGKIALGPDERSSTHWLYARLYQREDNGGYTQSSPFFLGETSP